MKIKSIDPNMYYKNESIRDIVKKGLGESYANSVKSLEVDDSVILVAVHNDSYVGFVCGYNHENPEEYIDYIDDNYESNSLLEKISVLSKYRNQGIATQLCTELLDKLKQPTITDVWVRAGSVDSTVLFEKFNFEKIDGCENRWYKESLKSNSENFCPDCGKICECNALAYIYRNDFSK